MPFSGSTTKMDTPISLYQFPPKKCLTPKQVAQRQLSGDAFVKQRCSSKSPVWFRGPFACLCSIFTHILCAFY